MSTRHVFGRMTGKNYQGVLGIFENKKNATVTCKRTGRGRVDILIIIGEIQ